MTRLRPCPALLAAVLASTLLAACAGNAPRANRTAGQIRAATSPPQNEPAIPSANLTQLQLEADQAYQEGRMLDAEQNYQRLLRAVPTSSLAWFRLGNIHLRTDRLEAAEYAYRECLKHAPRDIRCWQNLSLTYVEMSVATLDQAEDMSQDEAVRERLATFRRRLVESVGSASEEVK